ncbi:hypothetical protein PTKIN_Ptkin16aG0492800 [Pterospermum kingtungense]
MAATTTISLKLFVDPKSNKILFAEAGKDFVDFLFLFQALPVGTITSLLTKQEMVGCLGNLYDSIENLGDNYVHSKENIYTLLKPMVFHFAANASLSLLPIMQSSRNLYMCNRSCGKYVTNYRNTSCSCGCFRNELVTFVNPKNSAPLYLEGGYVKEAVTYMVTDDLVVRTMSATFIITLLNKFNVKDVGVLEQKVIDVEKDKGLELLRASMQSKAVLTDVFLGKEIPNVLVMASTTVSLELLAYSTNKALLSAEAGKDFVTSKGTYSSW